MSGKSRYQRAVGSLAGRKEDRPLVFSGELGVTTGGENVVEVAGRPGYVWVQLRNQLNELIQAFNDSVSPVFGLPVLVEWDKTNPIRYRVITRDVGRYTVWGGSDSSASAYLPVHGSQHSFNLDSGIGGGDVTWVYSQQFMPWLITPSGSAGSMSVSWQPHVYYMSGTFRYWGGTGTAIDNNLKPTGSSTARMLLLYGDVGTGNLLIATGSLTEFSATITGTAGVVPYIPPLVDADDIPLAGLRLVSGTSIILWTNLYDVRQIF
jgi:hypothetical protein